MPTPPLAITRHRRSRRARRASCSRSGPSSVPSRPIDVTTSAAIAEVVEPLRRARPGRRRCPPSSRGSPPPMPRASSPTATCPGCSDAELLDQLGALDRGGADDDPLDAGERGSCAGRLGAAHAPARLHPARHGRADRLDHAEVRRARRCGRRRGRRRGSTARRRPRTRGRPAPGRRRRPSPRRSRPGSRRTHCPSRRSIDG